jgi:amino acid adenylation domain-containing protein
MHPIAETFLEVFLRRASEGPDRKAFTFLLHGEGEELVLRYAELESRARALAGWLQAQELSGERVLLLYPPGLDYVAAFLGCLAAGAVAVPAYPPRPNRGQERLLAIAADAQPAAALTTARLLAGIDRGRVEGAAARSLQWLATDEMPDGTAAAWRLPRCGADDVVMLQYTSGSTAAPKGVMVTNANLLHNQELMRRAFGNDEATMVAGWLPLYHDMGLIGNVLQTLYLGASAVLMPPVAFLQKPLRWLEAISRYRATTSGGPDFAYELCVRRISPEERERLDLSSWRSAFNGAERVRAETLERFCDAFEPCGFRRDAFYPCYGLAEATLIVSGARERRPPLLAGDGGTGAAPLVGCGVALHDGSLRIVDPETLAESAPGETGEIWVRSPSVARGYWNRPQETSGTFGARLAGDPAAGSFLRTGDLGLLRGGELFVCGRLKDLIIVRGVNHYPEDLEWTAQGSHPALRPASTAAFAVEAGGAERLVIVQELEPGRSGGEAAASEVLEAIRRRVAETHEIEVFAVVLVRRGGVPKTSSGKVRRGACRRLFEAGELPVLAAWQAAAAAWAEAALPAPSGAGLTREEIAAWLAARIAERTGERLPAAAASLTLAQLGLDSLAVIELGHATERAFGVRLPADLLLGTGTIADLAGHIAAAAAAAAAEPDATAEAPAGTPAGPLSCGQEALWVACRLAPHRGTYNIAGVVRLPAPVDAAALRAAFGLLIRRHSLLRARFQHRAGAAVPIVQEIRERIEGWWEEREVSGPGGLEAEASRSALAQEADRPFDLERGPLFRAVLLSGAEAGAALLLVIHHTIADFWSLGILVRELGLAYDAMRRGVDAALPPLEAEYADYVAWQRRLLDGAEGQAQLAYWRGRLAGELAVPDLPVDRPRPQAPTHQGSSESLRIDLEVAARLRQTAAAHGVSLYTLLLTAFQVLLSRLTGQEEVVVGSPAAARTLPQWSNVVGYFANPLVLRSVLPGGLSFVETLAGTREMLAGAMAHQDYPLGRLQDMLPAARQGEAAGLFRVMFLFYGTLLGDGGFGALALNVDGIRGTLGGLPVETLAIPREIALYDLTFALAAAGDELVLAVKYGTDLFERATVRRLAGHYAVLLRGLTERAEQRIGELPLLTAAERRQLLEEWNATAEVPLWTGCIHELFERQAERTPGAAAVTFEGRSLSYAELERRAEQLAGHLCRLGVGPEVLVALCVERSFELVVAVLAVLKAGGAYVPLDPEYPRERLRFLLEDSGAGLVLTREGLLNELPPVAVPVVCLDRDAAAIARGDGRRPPAAPRAADGNLAYVIYTSGSTGQPKGVANTHRGVVNLLGWMQRRFALTPADVIAHKTAYGFDVSVWELFWPLAAGARMAVARPGGQRDRRYLTEWLAAEGVTLCHFVPPVLGFVLDGGGLPACRTLRHVLCGGEPLTRALAERLRESLPAAQLHNMYGPTEASVDATSWAWPSGWEGEAPPIGRPIANMQAHVLDGALEPAPAGVAGELFLGGAGLARGYLSRPGLTAERFLPHPFAAAPGERLYRSGDLARRLPDGDIVFAGRADDQIKLQGHRIELGEIASVLAGHPGVAGAVAVVAAVAGSGERQLVAYAGRRGGQAPGAEELKEFLRSRLPVYLVPSLFIVLDALPLAPNGKVNRKALPPPEAALEPRTSFVAPRTPTERLLARLWAEGLKIERVGVDDDFFELGGHSLLAAEISARLQEVLQTDAPLLTLFFQNPTISGLAAGLAENGLSEDHLVELVER